MTQQQERIRFLILVIITIFIIIIFLVPQHVQTDIDKIIINQDDVNKMNTVFSEEKSVLRYSIARK